MSKRRRTDSPQPSTSSGVSSQGNRVTFARMLQDSDDEEETETVNFFLDVKKSKSFKGSSWAEEKTYRISAEVDPSAGADANQFSLNQSIPQMGEMFDALIDDIGENHEDSDVARVFIDHPDLQSAIIVPPKPLGQLNSKVIMQRIGSVLHSAGEISVDGDLDINIAVVKRIGGQGGTKINTNRLCYMKDRVSKRCILRIPLKEANENDSEDLLCLPKAVLIGFLALQQKNAKSDQDKNSLKRKYENLLRPSRNDQLTEKTLELMEECGVPSNRQGFLDDIPLYEEFLKVSICVVSAKLNEQIIYPGSEKYRSADNRIYLYHFAPFQGDVWHFDVIKSMSAFMGKADYCYECDKALSSSSAKLHSCKRWCILCGSKECEIFAGKEILCSDCNLTCRSAACLKRHQKVNQTSKKKTSLCSKRYRCLNCQSVIKNEFRKKQFHVCGETFCRNCENWFANQNEKKSHFCHMRGDIDLTGPRKFIFYDFESTQSTEDHIPNLVIAQSCCDQCEHIEEVSDSFCDHCGSRCNECESWDDKTKDYKGPPCSNGECGKREKVIRGDDVTLDFGRWLIDKQHRDFTVIAHNAKAYDNYFILNYLLKEKIAPQVIFNGTKALYMRIGKGLNMRFLDSCMFLPMALSELPKCFDLTELKKGFFPHFFNKPENYFKVFPNLPCKEMYGYSTMTEEKQKIFLKWYEANFNNLFDFEQEMEDYCRSDVNILRQACLRYRSLMKEITSDADKKIAGIDPFCFVSAASVAMGVFRSRFLQETWQYLQKEDEDISCPHDYDSCKCNWKTVEKKHCADVFDLSEQQLKKISKKRFVKSPIGLLPPTEYRPKDNFSLEAISWLEDMEKRINEDRFARSMSKISLQTALSSEGEKEVRVPCWKDLPPAKYKLDGYFFDQEKSKHIALEFYGCHWHGCIKCYPLSERRSRTSFQQKSLDQRLEETLLREERLKNEGYELITIWACEYGKHLKKNRSDKLSSSVFDPHISLRDAYFGGRTAALKLYHNFRDHEDLNVVGKYVDFTSLYPWALKYGIFPVSHPIRFTGGQVKEKFSSQLFTVEKCQGDVICDSTVKYCPENIDHFHHKLKFFGIAKLTILPPKNLLHPILPLRCENGKLLFPLCSSCAERNNQESDCNCSDEDRSWTHTYCSGEIEIALDMGYQIIRVFEVLHWEEKSSNIFSGYVNTFLRIKQEASGFPQNVFTEEEKENYISIYREKEGICLNKDNIVKSSALRSLAKLMLNSLYGKFGQRTNLRKSHMIDNVPDLCEIMTAPQKKLVDFHILSDDVMHLETEDDESFSEMDLKTNVVISAFTASWARLKLWTVMQKLGDRLLYTDTDSLVFISVPGMWEPQVGEFLGELTDELTCKKISCQKIHDQENFAVSAPNHFISEFVAGGPKNYAYKLNSGEVVCKIRGFTLDVETAKILNFFSLKEQLFQWFHHSKERREAKESCDEIAHSRESCLPVKSDILVVRTQIFRDRKLYRVFNRKTKKRYGIVLDKNKVNLEDFSSVPFGYHS